MSIKSLRLNPRIRIEGSFGWRSEDARVTLLAFFDEVARDAAVLHHRAIDQRVPDLYAANVAGRMARRAAQARAEYIELTAPDDAA